VSPSLWRYWPWCWAPRRWCGLSETRAYVGGAEGLIFGHLHAATISPRRFADRLVGDPAHFARAR
jgi:hypothetical protein